MPGIRDAADTLIAWVIINRDWCPGMLHVEPEYRKRGFATALYQRVSKAVVKEGIVPVARIEVNNEDAVRFHQKCGYMTGEDHVVYTIFSPPYSHTVA